MLPGYCERISSTWRTNLSSCASMLMAPQYFSATFFIFHRPVPFLNAPFPWKLFSISIIKKSPWIPPDTWIYFSIPASSLFTAWFALSRSWYRQRQKTNFCCCHRQIFYYSLSKMPKQYDCCEMFLCCCEMPNKNLSITPSPTSALSGIGVSI